MTDRVSDGLLAELHRKIADGTPRGLVWPMQARIVLLAAPCVQDDADVAVVNDALALLIHAADEKAFDQIAMQACVDQLRDYLTARASSPQPDAEND